MPDRRILLVPLFLFTQALLVPWGAGRGHLPTPPELARFPSEFGEWRQLSEDPVTTDVARELQADQVLSRSYVDVSTGAVGSLFVAWFRRAGTSQPHSPKVCLPASGWVPEVTGEVTLETVAGAITVNRYVVVNRGHRAVVLYWYQGPRRVTAGELAAKLWLMADSLRDRRTDTALVRVVVQAGAGGEDAATAAAAGFARSIYPLLLERLPR